MARANTWLTCICFMLTCYAACGGESEGTSASSGGSPGTTGGSTTQSDETQTQGGSGGPIGGFSAMGGAKHESGGTADASGGSWNPSGGAWSPSGGSWNPSGGTATGGTESASGGTESASGGTMSTGGFGPGGGCLCLMAASLSPSTVAGCTSNSPNDCTLRKAFCGQRCASVADPIACGSYCLEDEFDRWAFADDSTFTYAGCTVTIQCT
jgi:hypothetical protein